MRSIWAKLSNLVEDLNLRQCDISILSEVWESKDNKKHQELLQETCLKNNLQYLSTARPSYKRGGGCAVPARGDKFNLTPLNVEIPKSVEACWCLLRPKRKAGNINKIIVCAFYCPPKSRKIKELIAHITLTFHSLNI